MPHEDLETVADPITKSPHEEFLKLSERIERIEDIMNRLLFVNEYNTWLNSLKSGLMEVTSERVTEFMRENMKADPQIRKNSKAFRSETLKEIRAEIEKEK